MGYFLTVTNGDYRFYVTTVDQTGHESVPSNTVEAEVTVGVPALTGDISMFKFGPNPFSSQLTVDLKTEKQTNLQAVIYDLNGKPCYTLISSQVGQGYQHFIWNGKDATGNDLPAGIYTLKIRTGGGMSNSYKLIKIR